MSKVIELTDEELALIVSAVELGAHFTLNIQEWDALAEKLRDARDNAAQSGVLLPLEEAAALAKIANAAAMYVWEENELALQADERIRAAQAASAGGETA